MAVAKMNPSEFVILWNKSSSITEFCRRSGYSPVTARQRATAYRQKGVSLKFLGSNLRAAEQVRELKDLAEQTRDAWDFDSVLEKYK